MSLAGNFRISNLFLSSASKNILNLNSNFQRPQHLNYLRNSLNHQQLRNLETTCDNPVKSKVAIITGGIKNIGYEIADQLLQAEAKAVVLADEHFECTENITAKLNKKYGESRSLFYPVDIKKRQDMLQLFTDTKERYQNLDMVINNVHVTSTLQNDLDVKNNVMGMVQNTFLGFQEMFGNGGVILNTAAILEHNALNGSPLFNKTNHFIVGFTRNLSRNYFYNPTNVKVMAVYPCFWKNERYIEGEDVTKKFIREKWELPGRTPNNYGKVVDKFSSTSPEEVGQAILKILIANENGSVWIAEPGKVYKIQTNQDVCLPPVANKSQVSIDLEKKHPLTLMSKKDPCAKQKKKSGRKRGAGRCKKKKKSKYGKKKKCRCKKKSSKKSKKKKC